MLKTLLRLFSVSIERTLALTSAAWVRVGLLVTASVALLTGPGCIERTYEIRSNPSGARVVVDGVDIGTTPVKKEFVHYGTRQIILSRKDYLREKRMEEINSPWYETFPIDFVVEMLVPTTVRDDRVFTYDLRPIPPLDKESLLQRAEETRKKATEPGGAE
jgi:hypothetical protein